MNRVGLLSLWIALGMVAGIRAIDCNNPPKRTDLIACCPHDLISQEIAEKCKSFLGPGSQPDSRKRLLNACYLECVVKATGIVNNMNINQTKLKTYLSSILKGNAAIFPVVQNAFTTCGQKLKELRETMKKNPPQFQPSTAGKCKPCLGVLLHCVHMETIYNCPASMWTASEECNNYRQFFKTCMPSLGEHPH